MPIQLNSGDDYKYTSFFALSAATATRAIENQSERQRVLNEIIRLLNLSVGRVYEKLVNKLDSDIEPRPYLRDIQIEHVTDWLHAAIVNDAAWLKNVDDKGRPKKLMKFGSFEQIMQEADKAMLKEAQKGMAVKLDDEDEELFMELADGYRLVRLLTPSALDRESAHMQHCIGGGAYDGMVLNRAECCFLSLRDPMNKPHVTMELAVRYSHHSRATDYNLFQISGKQNAMPIRKYIELLMPFLKRREVNLMGVWEVMGFLFDDDLEPWFIADISSWPMSVLQKYKEYLGILIDANNKPWLLRDFHWWPADVKSYFMDRGFMNAVGGYQLLMSEDGYRAWLPIAHSFRHEIMQQPDEDEQAYGERIKPLKFDTSEAEATYKQTYMIDGVCYLRADGQ